MREPARLSEAREGPAGKICPACGTRFSSADASFCPFDGEALVRAGPSARLRDPLLGTVIDGRYEVESILGEGGMGVVYRVTHRALGKAFALKVLRAELSREAELGLRFLREAQAAASVSHPNVVQITDFGTLETGQSYFVMELLQGAPLSQVVRRGGPLPAARAVRILRQILEGLAAAHRAGVIHRDLKPDNIYVGVKGEGEGDESVRVLDFGLARIAGQSRLTKQGLVFGTPHYMSPEQASGGTVDQRTDIYALGVVTYEMFTGRVPFEADTFMGVLTKHLYVEPTPPSVVLGGTRELGALEQVTLRCLEKKPERRFPSVESLIEELDRITSFSPDGALRVVPVEPSDRREFVALADELELPAGEEIAFNRRLPLRSYLTPWTLAGGFFSVVIVAGLAYIFTRPKGGPEASRSAGAAAGSIVRSAPLSPLPVPTVVPVPVEGAPGPDSRVPEASQGEGDVRRPRPPSRSGTTTQAGAGGDVRSAGPRRPSPAPSGAGGSSPSKGSTAKEKMVGNEIVDPWSQ